MGQLALLAVLALVGWTAWQSFAQRPARQRRVVDRPDRQATPLERDPATGIYRPIGRKE
jgi:hypothetical protein